MIDGDDDAALMQRHVEGDPDAFGEIVRRHRDRLWAVAIRTLGNPEDAADALQDALVNAFRRAGSFRAEAAVTTWLHRIVVNACIDRVRRTAARPSVVLVDDVDVASPGLDPGTQTALRLDVEAALATLPDEQRVPLVLVDMEGYPVSEVAEMLGCPVGTVKSRCARARARLLPLLTSHGSRDPLRGNRVAPADVPSTPAHGSGGEPL
ncbi:MAG TPA: RNA polymerase sigma factor SigM [Jiangellaceae bacterium]|nr:RNA polymerase sigma factor SigM [Jiangellaceae bacterium]